MKLKRASRDKLNAMSLAVYGCKSKWRTQLRKKVFYTDLEGVRRAKRPTLKDVYRVMLIAITMRTKQMEADNGSKKD